MWTPNFVKIVTSGKELSIKYHVLSSLPVFRPYLETTWPLAGLVTWPLNKNPFCLTTPTNPAIWLVESLSRDFFLQSDWLLPQRACFTTYLEKDNRAINSLSPRLETRTTRLETRKTRDSLLEVFEFRGSSFESSRSSFKWLSTYIWPVLYRSFGLDFIK